ncbi:hypothetical protein [Chroococcidiopsis sp. CCNUC1]|nr:hypothetical protein [Chroococcidiopsis sp. CCNUC1]
MHQSARPLHSGREIRDRVAGRRETCVGVEEGAIYNKARKN